MSFHEWVTHPFCPHNVWPTASNSWLSRNSVYLPLQINASLMRWKNNSVFFSMKCERSRTASSVIWDCYVWRNNATYSGLHRHSCFICSLSGVPPPFNGFISEIENESKIFVFENARSFFFSKKCYVIIGANAANNIDSRWSALISSSLLHPHHIMFRST